MANRALPHSIEAEASVLGAILLRNETLALVGGLPPEAFYHPGHGKIYAAMRELGEADQPIDTVTLEERLSAHGHLAPLGGLSYLSKLALTVPTADNAEHYAKIVAEKHGARTLILALSEGLQRGHGDYGSLSEYQAEVQAKIGEAISGATRTGPQPIEQVARELARELDRRYEIPGGITGVPTGYTDLDTKLAGLQSTDLVILAARPSMGKSALALCIAKRAAEQGHPVVVFSLEMSAIQLMERLVCAEASVSTTALRMGKVERGQLADMGASWSRLGELPIAFDETPALTHHDVSARARRFAAEHPSDRQGLVVVDYLQLMRGITKHNNREQEIAEISRGLKALAKTLGWPVLALSQLNRSLESRANKRPQLSDLRESGAIEQDADVVMFLYRDEVYDDNTAEPGIAELKLAKHRNGPPGVVKLKYDAAYTRFVDRPTNMEVSSGGAPSGN